MVKAILLATALVRLRKHRPPLLINSPNHNKIPKTHPVITWGPQAIQQLHIKPIMVRLPLQYSHTQVILQWVLRIPTQEQAQVFLVRVMTLELRDQLVP